MKSKQMYCASYTYKALSLKLYSMGEIIKTSKRSYVCSSSSLSPGFVATGAILTIPEHVFLADMGKLRADIGTSVWIGSPGIYFTVTPFYAHKKCTKNRKFAKSNHCIFINSKT